MSFENLIEEENRKLSELKNSLKDKYFSKGVKQTTRNQILQKERDIAKAKKWLQMLESNK